MKLPLTLTLGALALVSPPLSASHAAIDAPAPAGHATCAAALSGSAEAAFHLARDYMQGLGDVARDDAAAADWFAVARSNGYREANAWLAHLPAPRAGIPTCPAAAADSWTAAWAGNLDHARFEAGSSGERH